jgi:3-deoxy-D-manno-octulosonic-acid transferase
LKTKGIYFLYRFLQAFGLPVLLLYFLFRGLRNRGYWHSLPQRFGFLPRSFCQTGPGAIWLHAVSVGEVLSCMEFLRQLRAEFPRTRIFVSTSTLAGRATAGDKLGALADGVFYAPVDYVFAVRRVLRTLRPSVVAIAETEIWPNLFRETKRTVAALTLVNGRISDKAFVRYRRWRRVFAAVMPAVDMVLAQSEEIRERFLALGAPSDKVRVGGNFKYDFEPRELPAGSPVKDLLDRLQPAQVWIAASTMPPAAAGDVDEDDIVIAAFQRLAPTHPELMLILAPRKPERFAITAGKLDSAGISYARRSSLGSPNGTRPRVLLLDSIGELSGLFALADVVFMGGTLARRGGHNILEPALFGKPVITGPHMENFQAIAEDFRAAEASVAIASGAELAAAVERLLAAPGEAREIGSRARARAQAQRGASTRAVAEVRQLRTVPAYRPAMPWYALAWLLAHFWEWGAARRQRRHLRRVRRLPVPVISVGNLTMGGTGKTPCVLRLVELLKERGHRPGILTRGYGRQSPEPSMQVAAGETVAAQHSGDEAQIFIRSGLAPVGIGSDRFDSGTRLLTRFEPNVLVLDDGFQHRKLARDVDLVLIDALNPFGGGHVFPLGSLREPVAGLARAGMILITRREGSDLAEPIAREVRRWNPRAPIFQSSVEPRTWMEYGTGKRFALADRPFQRIGAFCGLGNPATFRHTLESLGVEIADWIEFDDHHRYRPRELRHLAQHMAARGATALATTQKDAINLCETAADLAAPLPLYWLEIGIRIESEDEFLRAIEEQVGSHREGLP